MKKRRSVKIEKRGKGHYEVIKYRKDKVGYSVGYATTKDEAKKIKKKHLYTR